MSRALIETLIETLRLGGEPDGDLVARWKRVSPTGLSALMGYEGGATWLMRRLRAAGALDALPKTEAEPLRNNSVAATAFRMQVEEEAAAVLGLLNGAGIPVILIKGMARCALAARYPYLNARVTSDVDLLLPPGRVHEADRLLRAAGYVENLPDYQPPPDHHHLPQVRSHRGVPVELHSSTSVRVPGEEAWRRAQAGSEAMEWHGLAVRVPCPTEIAWSAIAHGLVDGIRAFRLDRFLEAAALVSGGAALDWPLLEARARTLEASDPATPASSAERAVGGWLDAMLTFVAPRQRPAGLSRPSFDLESLLAWRLMVLRSPRLGRSLVGRMLEESPRILLGWPMMLAPGNITARARIRRRMAGHASRAIFHVWYATRTHRGAGGPSRPAGEENQGC